MVPCGSSPVTRARLYHAKNEAPEEEDGQTLLNGHPLKAFLNVIYYKATKNVLNFNTFCSFYVTVTFILKYAISLTDIYIDS